MKKLLFILLILLLPSVMASMEVESNLSINVTVGELKQGTFMIKNNDIFDYYYIHFQTPYDINISNISFLASGLEMNHTFTILTDHAYKENKTSLVKFSRKMQIQEDPVNYTIEITNNFIPNAVTMHDIDGIIFHNANSDNHTVTDVNGSFRYVLTPNEYLNLTFTQNTTVYDEVTLKTAKIYVVPFGEQYIHDDSLDINFSVNVDSSYLQTTMSLSVLEPELTCEYNGSVNSKILVQNTGNQTAYNIIISGSRINFSEHSFNIEKGKFKLIDYTVTMDIETEWDTNKTYPITMVMTGSNFESVLNGVNVFVPFMNLDQRTTLEKFCELDYGDLSMGERLQYDQYCSGKELVRTETKTETIVQEVEKTFGVSASDIAGWKSVGDRVAGLENTFNQRVPNMDEPLAKVNGQIQELDFKFSEQLNNITSGLLAQNTAMQAEKDASALKAKKALIWRWVWGIFVGFMALTTLILVGMKNISDAQSLDSGF